MLCCSLLVVCVPSGAWSMRQRACVCLWCGGLSCAHACRVILRLKTLMPTAPGPTREHVRDRATVPTIRAQRTLTAMSGVRSVNPCAPVANGRASCARHRQPGGTAHGALARKTAHVQAGHKRLHTPTDACACTVRLRARASTPRRSRQSESATRVSDLPIGAVDRSSPSSARDAWWREGGGSPETTGFHVDALSCGSGSAVFV